jgi:HK97 gp10 family phage protein
MAANNLSAIGIRVREAAVAALNEGAEITAQRAKSHAPVRTGRLRDEIVAVPANGGGGSHHEARVESPTPYGVFQEYGTGHHKPHPYLRPALHESHEAVTELVRSSVRKATKGAKVKVRVRL